MGPRASGHERGRSPAPPSDRRSLAHSSTTGLPSPLGLILLTLVAWIAPRGTQVPAAEPSATTQFSTARATPIPVAGPLHAATGRFWDAQGRVVILRGVNLSGDAKVPPFRSGITSRDLDLLARYGFNVIRLLVIWEAYEPQPGVYDEVYLDSLIAVARLAQERGIHTIIDIHQDGFSRFASCGCGDGFPAWALANPAQANRPDNGPACRRWPLLMAFDPATYRSFDRFYKDERGVRTRFLHMAGRLASRFSQVPGVIGYDCMNEPWGWERSDLMPLYADMAAVIRHAQPGAILFLEGHVLTNSGLISLLPRPPFDNVAYAPHYYPPLAVITGHWNKVELPLTMALDQMARHAARWDAPLFLGEFGLNAGTAHAQHYIAAVYDRLDHSLASGAQWNHTPNWTPERRDGWNHEDYAILDRSGRPRANFRPRPFPQAVAGLPLRFEYQPGHTACAAGLLQFDYWANPELGITRVYLPACDFGNGLRLRALPAGVTAVSDSSGQFVDLISQIPGPIRVQIEGWPSEAWPTD